MKTRVRGAFEPAFLNRFREKRWCYAGIVGPEFIFGCAVVHLGYAASAFVYAYDRRRNEMAEHSVVLPPLPGIVRFDRDLEMGLCRFRSGRFLVEIGGYGNPGEKTLRVRVDKPGCCLDVEADLVSMDGLEPVYFLMPMGRVKLAFTAKAAGFGVRGMVRINGRGYGVAGPEVSGIFDWTHGYYRRHTFWNWACGAGTARDGSRVGFNFSRGVYENGKLENTVWMDGRSHEVGPVGFEYDPKDPGALWQVRSADGLVDLEFLPEGRRIGNENLGLIQSRFIQPCGRFQGRLMSPGGRVVVLDRAFGVTEEHFAKW